jgi:hypothetical protein
MRSISTIVLAVYLLVGVFIANNHHYFANTHGLKGILSAVLAILLWPLVLLGVNLHIGGSGGKGVLVPLPAIGARLAARRRERA